MSSTTAEAPIPSQTVTARPRDERRVSLLILCLLALGVGILTGVGAVALRALIGLIHNVMINGVFKIAYDANILEGPSRWGNWVILSPILGGLVVVYLVDRFAPEAKGHGVPEVMDAVFYKRGDIRGVVALIKSLASALSIGSGASVGREGPIIQIGAALGSSFSKAIGLSTGQKITLLSAGAGAGIAATFNTPLGGVLFAIEILLPEVSNRTFLPVVIATGAATLLGRILIGPSPAFAVPEIFFPSASSFGVEEAIAFVVLGALCGVASWAFIRLLVFMEDGFPKIPGGKYAQNIIGMTMIGLMMVGLTHMFGHSYVDGVGYGVIQSILDKDMTATNLLVLLFVLKLAGDHDQPRLRRFGRHLLALALSRRDAWRGFRLPRGSRPAQRRLDVAVRRDRRHGGDGRRGNGRRHDRHHHGVRDDARLRDHRARHRRRRGRRRRQARAHPRDDLHHKAPPPRPPHPEGAARQSVPRPAGARHHGAAFHRRQGRFELARMHGPGGRRRSARDHRRAGGPDRGLDPAPLRPLARKREQSRAAWWTISSRSAQSCAAMRIC